METLFISRDAKLRQRENTLAITVDGRTRSFPIEKIRHLVLLGESDLNSRLLILCGKHGVRLSVFDYHGYFKGAFEPIGQSPSGKVKLAQAKILLDDVQSMGLAREIVRGATHNMRANLLYHRYRGNVALEPCLTAMQRLSDQIARANDTPTLMGIEGNIHQFYYDAWSHIDRALDFRPRVRRPPNNPINCLLSFLNQLTYTVVRHETFKTHLEESFSVLHGPGVGRASLSLDLAEPFKPVLVDALIFKLVRQKMIDETWFNQQEGVCLLTESGRRHVAEEFSIRLEKEIQGRTYREWIYREALAIERHVLGVAEYESFNRMLKNQHIGTGSSPFAA